MIVAGIGCRKGTDTSDIVAAIDAAAAAHGIERQAISALAVLGLKQAEVGIAEAARLLGLGVITIDAERARAVSGETITVSAASLAVTGTGSASEAAALAAAGPDARLLGPRTVHGHVTCALAEGKSRR